MPSAWAQRWFVERVEHPQLPLLVATDESGAVTAVVLNAASEVLTAERDRRPPDARAELRPRVGAPSSIARQLRAYLYGEWSAMGPGRSFEYRGAALGTEFEREVWTRVAAIGFGETRSYGALASAMGRPGAARAVGRANGANPLPLLVPCHRVIGSQGQLTGFAGGLPAKRWLLAHESPQSELFAEAGAHDSNDVNASRPSSAGGLA